MSIYKTAVERPVTTALCFVAFVIFGIFSLLQTSISLYPDFDSTSIMVITTYPGASAADVENNVTRLLENSLNGVSDLKDMTSRSRDNSSLITLNFNYGVDIEAATNNVRDKLDMVNSSLPAGISRPVIFKFSGEDIPIMILSARANESLPGLGKILDEKLVSNLGRIKGVGTISVVGAPSREINVYCDPVKLQAYHLSVPQISSIIANENRNIPSGSITIGSDTYSLKVQKEFKDPSEINNLVVSNKNGNIVYLKDVAKVVDGRAEDEEEGYSMGERAAQIIIQKQNGANTVTVIKDVKKELSKIESSLPSDIKITTVIDGSTSIINSINSLKQTIFITLLVVMLVVYLFLFRWRATLIIVISIPIALLASLVYLYATGNTLNVISMSALSIAIGMVVDDAIVVLENITNHIDKGEDPKEAAVSATSEVAISVIASTLTMLCVFLPLTLVPGLAGILFRQLGWIVSIIMIVSTAAALTLVPMMCSRMLKSNNKSSWLSKIVEKPMNASLSWMTHHYGRIINWALNHRLIIILISLTAFIVSVGFIAPMIKTDFFPKSDQGMVTVTVELPVGTSQAVTREFAHNLYEKFVDCTPKKTTIINYSLGQASASNTFGNLSSTGTNIIKYNVNLGSPGERTETQGQIADKIREVIKGFPEIKKSNVKEGFGGAVGGASTLVLEVYGYDFGQTDDVANMLKDKLYKSGDFSQITLSRDEYSSEIRMDFDRNKLALNGLNSTAAAAILSSAIGGSASSYYREDGDEYMIRVRYDKDHRQSFEDIENIVVTNGMGQPIRLKELGHLVEAKVPPTIERKNRERMIAVNAVLADGKALSDAVNVANDIIKHSEIPSNINVQVAGDFENQKEMFVNLFALMILIVLLVYIVMASQFESFMSPFVIMFSIPFALVGVLLGLWITGTSMGVMALIGIIILLGIVVKNGIVLIDYTIILRHRGMSLIDACVEAAKSRFRPILMTTLTTVLGMLPLAIGTGEGAEMWRSLGMTVCWGLTVSTLVTLVLIPTIYCAFSARGEKRRLNKTI